MEGRSSCGRLPAVVTASMCTKRGVTATEGGRAASSYHRPCRKARQGPAAGGKLHSGLPSTGRHPQPPTINAMTSSPLMQPTPASAARAMWPPTPPGITIRTGHRGICGSDSIHIDRIVDRSAIHTVTPHHPTFRFSQGPCATRHSGVTSISLPRLGRTALRFARDHVRDDRQRVASTDVPQGGA
jgi:hypothetical protein